MTTSQNPGPFLLTRALTFFAYVLGKEGEEWCHGEQRVIPCFQRLERLNASPYRVLCRAEIDGRKWYGWVDQEDLDPITDANDANRRSKTRNA